MKHYDHEFNEIYLDTTKGRATRLLIKVEDGKPLLTKEHIDRLINNELTWDSLITVNRKIIDSITKKSFYKIFPL